MLNHQSILQCVPWSQHGFCLKIFLMLTFLCTWWKKTSTKKKNFFVNLSFGAVPILRAVAVWVWTTCCVFYRFPLDLQSTVGQLSPMSCLLPEDHRAKFKAHLKLGEPMPVFCIQTSPISLLFSTCIWKSAISPWAGGSRASMVHVLGELCPPAPQLLPYRAATGRDSLNHIWLSAVGSVAICSLAASSKFLNDLHFCAYK